MLILFFLFEVKILTLIENSSKIKEIGEHIEQENKIYVLFPFIYIYIEKYNTTQMKLIAFQNNNRI